MDVKQVILDIGLVDRVKEKKFIIYPFGDVGRKLKEILNNEFGLFEDAVVDNSINNYENVKGIDYFDCIDTNAYMLIIASDSLYIYDEIRNIIREKFPFENVLDLSGAVNTNIDCRIESLRLCADVINQNGIKGSIAEAGVFEGDFAQFMNLFFKDRTFYLFDTFEGFQNEQLKKNVDKCWKNWIDNNYEFVSSGIESVRKKMKYPEKCIFKKGFFPNTTCGIKDTFCFVNLDMDIYQSTKDGLEYFWPRMEKGGIIFIHDYVSWNCPGVKKAVDEFCKENMIGIGCLPDYNGTAIMIK